MTPTLTKSRNLEEIETLLELLHESKLRLVSRAGPFKLCLGLKGPVGEGRGPTSRLILRCRQKVLSELLNLVGIFLFVLYFVECPHGT